MARSICVCCGNEAAGLPVEEDSVIRGLRFVKAKLHMKVNNSKLVWCRQCYPKHVHATVSASKNQNKTGVPVVVLQDPGRHPTSWVERVGYEESRRNYESRQMTYIAIGVIFGILGVLISFGIGSIIAAIVVIIFLYLMSLLTYTPKIAVKTAK
ncbi:MAG: hypothetical protein KGH53_00175 [Candidatus Micrarchaeota archaeon]|nr:hypothetical protein [Candidatus Micrarchaeota archaeon]